MWRILWLCKIILHFSCYIVKCTKRTMVFIVHLKTLISKTKLKSHFTSFKLNTRFNDILISFLFCTNSYSAKKIRFVQSVINSGGCHGRNSSPLYRASKCTRNFNPRTGKAKFHFQRKSLNLELSTIVSSFWNRYDWKQSINYTVK